MAGRTVNLMADSSRLLAVQAFSAAVQKRIRLTPRARAIMDDILREQIDSLVSVYEVELEHDGPCPELDEWLAGRRAS